MPKGEKIRAVQFLSGTVRAGAEEVALELARGLDPGTFESYLVCPQDLLDAFGKDIPKSVRTHAITLASPTKLKAGLTFKRWLRAEQIDIVHAHMIRAAMAGVPWARMAGVSVVLHTCHGREAWRKSWLSRRYVIDRSILRFADTTIAVSESTKDYLVSEKGMSPDRVQVIRNGRPMRRIPRDPLLEELVRAEWQIPASAPLIGVFARLEPQKGHCYLIDALPSILANVPALHVIFAGDGVLRNDLEQQARARGVDRAVHFLGYRNDCSALMAMCDFVVLPSLYEGMPLVPIEAAAAGRTVVATAVDGTREVVVPEETGLLVRPADPQELADAVLRLLTNADLMDRLGQRARARAVEHFSLEQQVKRTADLYLSLIGVKSKAAVA